MKNSTTVRIRQQNSMTDVITTLRTDNDSMRHMLDALSNGANAVADGGSTDLEALGYLTRSLADYQNQFMIPRETILLDTLESSANDGTTVSVVHELRAEHNDMKREIELVADTIDQVATSGQPADLRTLRDVTDAYVEMASDHLDIRRQQMVPAATDDLAAVEWQHMRGELHLARSGDTAGELTDS